MLRDVVRNSRREVGCGTAVCRHGCTRSDIDCRIVASRYRRIVRDFLGEMVFDSARVALSSCGRGRSRPGHCCSGAGGRKAGQDFTEVLSHDSCDGSFGVDDAIDRRQQRAVSNNKLSGHASRQGVAR